MTCEELRDDYAAYAIGSATEPERSEISAHLARNCPVCLRGVRAALVTTAAMSGAVKMVDPPKGLRRRIIALVRPEGGRSWAALLPVAFALGIGFAMLLARMPGGGLRADQKLTQALSILDDPSTKDVSFGDPSARGRVFVSPDKGVVFIAAHLPALETGKTFELWVIPQSGNPIPAGTFESEKDSTAVYVRQGPVTNAAAVAVTVEPSGGSALPTTKPFIVTKL